MRLLLDSHVFLWWVDDDARIGPRCGEAVDDADEVFVSVVTPWELGIKAAKGRLVVPDDFDTACRRVGFQALDVTIEHAEAAPALPLHHQDPFDRMLIAQAQLEALILVTADAAFGDYEVELLDART